MISGKHSDVALRLKLFVCKWFITIFMVYVTNDILLAELYSRYEKKSMTISILFDYFTTKCYDKWAEVDNQ